MSNGTDKVYQKSDLRRFLDDVRSRAGRIPRPSIEIPFSPSELRALRADERVVEGAEPEETNR